MRLRDIAASLGISERSVYVIVTGLAEAGYVVEQKDGRRNRYQVQAHLPLAEFLRDSQARRPPRGGAAICEHAVQMLPDGRRGDRAGQAL